LALKQECAKVTLYAIGNDNIVLTSYKDKDMKVSLHVVQVELFLVAAS
jgi:hypothetical protein